MADSKELQPCPYCLWIPEMVESMDSIRFYRVECMCHACGPRQSSRKAAICAWNTISKVVYK